MTALRTAFKKVLMSAYCHGFVPSRCVAWCFRVFGLKHL